MGGGLKLVHPLPCPSSGIVPLPMSGGPGLAHPHPCPFPLQTSTQGFSTSSRPDTPPGRSVQNGHHVCVMLTCLRTAVMSDAHTHTHTVG